MSLIIITDIHTCEIKNVLKLNLKNGKQIKKFEAEIPYILKNAQPGLEKRGSYKKKRLRVYYDANVDFKVTMVLRGAIDAYTSL